jgi:plastocyanin
VFDNVDSAAHTATATDRSFSTPSIKKGKSSKPVVLKEAREYAYFCDFHPYMKGTVEVK